MIKFNPWLASALCAAGLALPLLVLYRSGDAGFAAVGFLFSGSAFADRPIVTGGALDQGSLQKEFFLLCYSFMVLCPLLALVRWFSLSTPRPLRVVLGSAAALTLVHPFSILTIFTWDAARYLGRMGATPMRVVGLMVALIMYGALTLFALWLVGIRMKRPYQTSNASSKPAPDTASSARAE